MISAALPCAGAKGACSGESGISVRHGLVMMAFPERGIIAVYDTEFTSWPGFSASGWSQPGRHREIIQIGAVLLDAGRGFCETDAFECLVRPVRNPALSDYIIELTGITQERVDAAGVTFPKALRRFRAFLAGAGSGVFSFGNDGVVVAENCRLANISVPTIFAGEHDLEKILLNSGLIDADAFSSDLPARFGLPMDHPRHDALGDARALAAVLAHLRANEIA